MKHIGEIIKQKFEESGMTKAEFAEKIDLQRTTVYYLFERQSIDIELLEKITTALNYDFMYEVYKYQKQKEATPSPAPTVFVAVEVEAKSLKHIALPDDFIQLIKQKK